MSKYKVEFMVDSRANAFSDNRETIDLVDEWEYSEEEAKEIINNEDKLRKIFEDWMWGTIDFGYWVLESDGEVKENEKLENEIYEEE